VWSPARRPTFRLVVVEALNESEIEHIISAVPLRVPDPIIWNINASRIRSTVPVAASPASVAAKLVLDLSIP
jgi:hypothetical protein